MLKNRGIVVSADMNRKISDGHRAHEEKHGHDDHKHHSSGKKDNKDKDKNGKHQHRGKHHRPTRGGKPGQLIQTKKPEPMSVPISMPPVQRTTPIKTSAQEPMLIFPKFSYGNSGIFEKSAVMPVLGIKPTTISVIRAFIPPEVKSDPELRHVNVISGVVSWEALESDDGESFTELCVEISSMLTEPGKAPPPGLITGNKEQIIYRTNDSALMAVCPSRTTHFHYVHELVSPPGRTIPIWYKVQAFVTNQGTSARLKDQTPVSISVSCHEVK